MTIDTNSFIRFLDPPASNESLLYIMESRPWLQRVGAIARACIRLGVDIANRSHHYFNFRQEQSLFLLPVKGEEGWLYPEDSLPWSQASQSSGLFLFIHGLRGSPLSWGGYLRELKAKSPQAHLLAPHVAEGGNCSLETAAEPFVAVIKNYLERFPGRPITLLGTSNGGRILSYLECRLTSEEIGEGELNIVSIAGVHYGTKWVEWLENAHMLWTLRFHPALSEEFRWGGKFAKGLLDKWIDKQAEWEKGGVKVRHLFCSTLEDEQVMDSSSSRPLLKGECEYRVLEGENHLSIVPAAQQEVLKWLKRESP